MMYIPWGTIYRGEHVPHGIYVCLIYRGVYTVGPQVYTVGDLCFCDVMCIGIFFNQIYFGCLRKFGKSDVFFFTDEFI